MADMDSWVCVVSLAVVAVPDGTGADLIADEMARWMRFSVLEMGNSQCVLS